MNYRHLHILHDTKFTLPFIKFIKENFPKNEHFFAVYSRYKIDSESYNYKNVWVGKNFLDLFHLSKVMNSSERIYIHSFNIHKFIQLLFIQPWLLKKSYWIIWGADLLFYKNIPKGLYYRIYEMMRKVVIKNLGSIITHTPGDYRVAQEVYKTKAKLWECIYYPEAFPHLHAKDIDIKNNEKGLKILLGNSASESNNHKEIILKLSKLKDQDFSVICPLSYGNEEYAKEVIVYGKQLLENRFNAITEFLEISEYFRVLAKVDVAIFNFDRQQALGNIVTLFYLGKKIFLKDNTNLTEMLNLKGLKFYLVNQLESELFKPLDISVKDENREQVNRHFSREKSKQDWGRIFNN